MLIDLILEGKVQGRIDQVGMRLELDRQCVYCLAETFEFTKAFDRQNLEKRRYAALEKWTEAIEGVHAAITQKASSGSRNGESSLMNPAEITAF